MTEDPERNATTLTGWHFWTGRSKAEIDQLAKNAGERIVNVQLTSSNPLLFNAVMVNNSGPYARTGGWSYGTELDVTTTINAEQGRLINLAPYTVNQQRHFAYVWVRNEGAAAKGWHWNYDLTVDQVTAEINKYKIRLIDLHSYTVNGQRRYSYIGIPNEGVDGKAWWWYPDVTSEFVQQKAQENKARLIVLDRPSAGLMTVVMQRNDEGPYSRHVYDYTLNDLLRFRGFQWHPDHRFAGIRQAKPHPLYGDLDRERDERESAHPVNLAVESDGQCAIRERRLVRHFRQGGRRDRRCGSGA